MPKIDCSVAVNFLREYKRMCDSYEHCCQCAFNEPARSEGVSCNMYCKEHPEIAVENVQAWSDEHPQKTRLDDLLEKYPKFEVFSETGRPMYKPRMFGYCTGCSTCPNNKAEHCWNEPVDGGATGKAVE